MQKIIQLSEVLEDNLKILGSIYEIVCTQNKALTSENLDMDLYDTTVDEIDMFVSKLEENNTVLDELLVSVKENIDRYRAESPEAVQKCMTLSEEIDSLNQKISDIEKKNKESIRSVLDSRHREIENNKRSVAGIQGYFKSMGAMTGNPTIMDNKI